MKKIMKRWAELPDFQVYSDQMLNIVNEELAKLDDFYLRNPLTKTMINNYVKQKILPKPIKKKYEKSHIAYLSAITLLKPVLSIPELSTGISIIVGRMGIEEAFDQFCQIIEIAKTDVEQLFQSPKNGFAFSSDRRELKVLYLVSISLWTKLLSKKILSEGQDD